MARTIKEIKREMTDAFIQTRAVVSAYGITPSKEFEKQFSAASIENILFYVFAFAVWALETLFDKHVDEVDKRIDMLMPHTLRWYVDKAKAFMHNRKLVVDGDYYDTAGMTEAEVDAARVVKFANATESNTVVYLKVAGADAAGNPKPLTAGQLTALRAYLAEVKDAGVSVQVRNEPADVMKLRLKIYYNPALMTADGTSSDGRNLVAETIRRVITSLPFNGLYRNSDLLAALDSLEAVEVVDIISVQAKAANAETFHDVVGFDRPFSGYYTISDSDIVVDYQPYSDTDTD